jgi:hypothetical protein
LKDDILQGNEDRFRKDLIRLARLGADRQRELIEKHYLLHQAAEQNSTQIVNLLLSAKPDTNARNLYGRTALHIAAASRHEDAPKIITSLICHGADVNMREGACQWLPLHWAVESQVAENAVRLIDAGAEVNATVPTLGAPIHLAIDALQNSPETSLAMITRLLAARADPNSRDYHGNTPLHRVRQAESQIAQCLLEAGADPNAQDHEGRAPLHIAVLNDEYFLAERLYNAVQQVVNMVKCLRPCSKRPEQFRNQSLGCCINRLGLLNQTLDAGRFARNFAAHSGISEPHWTPWKTSNRPSMMTVISCVSVALF